MKRLAPMENNTPVNDTQEALKFLLCVAPGCQNTSLNNKHVQLHSFPASKLGELWEAALGTVACTPSPLALPAVCSNHFRDEDYFERRYLEGNVEKACRTLKQRAIPYVYSSEPLQTEIQIKEEVVRTEITSPETAQISKQREDKALGLLTQKFMEVLKSSPNGIVDIYHVVEQLKISKRRIYDITNVLEGVDLIKKSKSSIQWLGAPVKLMDERGKSLAAEERKLDDMIRYTKQQIQDMFENILSNRYTYLTYKDIQSIPIFQDQTVFVIKAPRETTLKVAHPKEAFQMHIVSKMGPVEVLGCTDTVHVNKRRRQKSKLDDGDYSNLPLRRTSTAATTCKDYANHTVTSSNLFKCPSVPTRPLTQVPNNPTCPKPSVVLSPHEDQMNSSLPILPLSICIKEEMNILNITPDEPLNESFAAAHEPDLLSTDVHMTDLS